MGPTTREIPKRSVAHSESSNSVTISLGPYSTSIQNKQLESRITSKEATRSKIADALKLIAVVLPPLVALIAISWLSLEQATKNMDEAKYLKVQMRSAQIISDVVNQLQKERGMSCVYLSDTE